MVSDSDLARPSAESAESHVRPEHPSSSFTISNVDAEYTNYSRCCGPFPQHPPQSRGEASGPSPPAGAAPSPPRPPFLLSSWPSSVQARQVSTRRLGYCPSFTRTTRHPKCTSTSASPPLTVLYGTASRQITLKSRCVLTTPCPDTQTRILPTSISLLEFTERPTQVRSSREGPSLFVLWKRRYRFAVDPGLRCRLVSFAVQLPFSHQAASRISLSTLLAPSPVVWLLPLRSLAPHSRLFLV